MAHQDVHVANARFQALVVGAEVIAPLAKITHLGSAVNFADKAIL